MDNVRDALLRMYKTARRLKKVSDGLRKIGMGDEPIFNAYGEAVDAIYYLIGETRPFEDSVTRLIVETMSPEEDRIADMLMIEYEKNHQLPAPQLMSKEQMAELYKQNGGYMQPTPEGEWT